MAKVNKEAEILDKILPGRSDGDMIERMVDNADENFPDAASISMDYSYQDPFKFPSWCDEQNYSFAWIELRDDIQRHHAMEVEFLKIVTRTSSCIKGRLDDRDFRNHGAVERQGMILMFRPRDLAERMRSKPVLAHKETVAALQAGKEDSEKKWDIDYSNKDSKIDVVAYEEAGTEGIKTVE